MANKAHGFDIATDRKAHGLDGSTHGRVTLYCNPHDAVISALTVQGIGWRGMDAAEIDATRGKGVFTQRVFAQGFEVGTPPRLGADGRVLSVYDAWADHYAKPDPSKKKDKDRYWSPPSPPVKYDLVKGLQANTTKVGKMATFVFSPLVHLGTLAASTPINAVPPDRWVLPLAAPALPEPFVPQARRFENSSEAFDQGFDPPGAYRDKHRARPPDDPYAGVNAKDGRTDVPLGNRDTEASLRYEDHAVLRMQARREGRYKANEPVVEEDQPEKAKAEYQQWRKQKIATSLKEGLDVQATDHSTIMTQSMHAQKALAYDVAVGCCDVSKEELRNLRIAADWRLLGKIKDRHSTHKLFSEYFESGLFQGSSVHKWANPKDGKTSEGKMPSKIDDKRSWQASDRPAQR